MNIKLEVDVAEFVSEMCINMSREELLDFVKQIDREVADFDFTEELRVYFAKEVESEDLFMDDQ